MQTSDQYEQAIGESLALLRDAFASIGLGLRSGLYRQTAMVARMAARVALWYLPRAWLRWKWNQLVRRP